MAETRREQKATLPQPELGEQELDDPGLRDLSRRDYVAILKRSGKQALADSITDAAAALAYYSFLAIPAALLLALGLFGLLAGPNAIDTVIGKLATVMPEQAVTLFRDSLTRAAGNRGSSLTILVVGAVLAVWTATGAMNALMRAFNRAYGRGETRGFVRQRLTALTMVVLAVLAFGLVVGLLVLGPHLSRWVGDAVGLESAVSWIWWSAQWPILIGGLLLAFAGMLWLGPNVVHPRWHFVVPGAVLAVSIWLGASALFAFYVSQFGSYNKAWGTLAGVVITLTWLWLSGIALLLGAEVNAEIERSRELRRGRPARHELQAPTRA